MSNTTDRIAAINARLAESYARHIPPPPNYEEECPECRHNNVWQIRDAYECVQCGCCWDFDADDQVRYLRPREG